MRSNPMRIMIVQQAAGEATGVAADVALDLGWVISNVSGFGEAIALCKRESVDTVVIREPDRQRDTEKFADFDSLVRHLDGSGTATLLVTHHRERFRRERSSLIEAISPTTSASELKGRLSMIERYHGLVSGLERELHNMHRLGKRLSRHFQEVDQEMRLAGRLQRDFLPDTTCPIRNANFAAAFRPASWVSGDIYDVYRVDERFTAFYLVDAVGHGMAAGLLTMFIKRAIVSKQLTEGGYRVMTPSETMSLLNEALCAQTLPHGQFVTGCYGLFNHDTMELSYARGGHPYPILISASGDSTDLKASGGLLGVFPGEEFETFETQLSVGDKVLLYSDGVEFAFPNPKGAAQHHTGFFEALSEYVSSPVAELIRSLERRIDQTAGSLEPHDDITFLGMEVVA